MSGVTIISFPALDRAHTSGGLDEITAPDALITRRSASPGRSRALAPGCGRTAPTCCTNAKHFFWAHGSGAAGDRRRLGVERPDLPRRQRRRRRDRRRDRSPPSTSSTGAPSGRPASRPPTPTGSSTRARPSRTTSNSFFGNVGGSPWAGVQTQYCNGVLPGSTSCVGGTGFVTNPRHQLKGVWTDPTPVPADIVTLGLAENLVDDPIAAEAQRAVGALRLRPAGDVHHPDAAEHDRDRAARLLRLPHADHERRRLGNPYRAPVRVHPVAEHELARRRHDRLRHAQRQRDERRVRQRHLRRLQHRHRPRVRRGRHRPGQLRSRTRTAGTTPRAARTATSARGRTRRTSRSAAHQFAVQPLWSNEASTRPATAASSRADAVATRRIAHVKARQELLCRSRRCGAARPIVAAAASRRLDAGDDHDAEDRLDDLAALDPVHRGRRRRFVRRRQPADDALLPPPRRLRHEQRQPAPQHDQRYRRRRRLRADRRLRRRASAGLPTRQRSSTSRRPTACRSRFDASRGVAGVIDISGTAAGAAQVDVSLEALVGGQAVEIGSDSETTVLDPTVSDNAGRVHDPARPRRWPAPICRGSTCACTSRGRASTRASSGCPASRGPTSRPTPRASTGSSRSRSTTRRSRTPIPARLDANGSTWSVAIPTPAVGKHTIYARVHAGVRRLGAGGHDLHGEEVITMKQNASRARGHRGGGVAHRRARRVRAPQRSHQPIYMPNTQNVGNPTLQPPPVCCAPTGPPVAGRAGAGEHGLLRRSRPGDPEDLPRLLGLGRGRRVRPHDARHADLRPGRRGRTHDRVRQGDRRHDVGRRLRRSTTRPSTARTSTSRTRRTSSAASGTTTRTRSTTT